MQDSTSKIFLDIPRDHKAFFELQLLIFMSVLYYLEEGTP